MTDNISRYLHYDVANGSIVEPIDNLYIKSLTVLDVDDPNNEGIAIDADISVANDKNWRVQTIEGVDSAGDPAEKQIDLIGSLVFDPGFGIYFPSSDDKLSKYHEDLVSVLFDAWPFGWTQTTAFKARCVRIGNLVTLTFFRDDSDPFGSVLHTGGALSCAAGTIPVLYRPNATYSHSSLFGTALGAGPDPAVLEPLLITISGSDGSLSIRPASTVLWPAGTYQTDPFFTYRVENSVTYAV